MRGLISKKTLAGPSVNSMRLWVLRLSAAGLARFWKSTGLTRRVNYSAARLVSRETLTTSFREVIVERLHGREFVLADVKYCIQLGHVQYIVHLLGQVQELQLATCIAHSRKRPH